jgi:hypothetical protein
MRFRVLARASARYQSNMSDMTGLARLPAESSVPGDFYLGRRFSVRVSGGRFYPPANGAILSSGSEYLASRGRRTLTQRQGRHLSPDCHPVIDASASEQRETIMIFAASWAISARLHNLFRRFAPSNILIRRTQTRTGIKWGPLVGVAAAVLYGLLMLATATVLRKGGPGWVDLIVLLAFWNTVKFTCLIPVSLVRLLRARHQERVLQRDRIERAIATEC